MKIIKILIVSVIFLSVFNGNNFAQAEGSIYDYTGENIRYIIKPAGRSEYSNLGTVDFKGAKASLIVLKSKILFIEVTEKIFSDPESLLPYKTERTTSGLWSKEYRTEEYDQKKFTVVIRKFKNAKLIKEQIIKADGPIQNVNLLIFYLRMQPDLKVGWHFTAKVLDELKLFEFDLKLISIDEITVPAGKFQAYHFKSVPAKFEIWVTKNNPKAPVGIKVKSVVDCFLLMKEYALQKGQNHDR